MMMKRSIRMTVLDFIYEQFPWLRSRHAIEERLSRPINSWEDQVQLGRELRADPRLRQAYLTKSTMAPMPMMTALLPPDIDFESKEPWSPDTKLLIPVESSQVLIHESAAILGAQAFLNIVRLPYTIRECPNAADISPNGKLPVVKCGAFVVSELEGIVQLAQAKGVSLSDYLSANQKADLRAYMSLVHNVLGNALLYFTWLDTDVYNHFTFYRSGSPYNFPLRILVPWYIRRKISSQLNSLNWGERTPAEVYREVETCLLALSERLGEAEYFFGESPTELDALVFGYLFTMITTPLPNNQLGNIVKHQPNLVKFCQHMEKEYFSQSR